MAKSAMTHQFGRCRDAWHASAVLLFALAATGCGGANAPPEAGKGTAGAAGGPARTGTADACALLSQSEIAEAVGNPVLKGQPFAGPEVCKWDTENPDHVSVLLTVRLKGSTREPYLCDELRKGGGGGERVEGLGDIAVWKFSSAARLFNSGDLETCGGKGFLSLSLNGKRDEPALKQAVLAIARKALERL